ncbi:MAG: molybdopterin-dependent oxidoreductase [Deltaproteobacteria bacterium]|nr:molybdopterin-dependent oxidoreductase [Deltaproteobacteria bacterium]
MKLDRRGFIELVVGASIGGGTGIMLSPLNWKLMDDIAIWTQNWPWTPVPETGEVTTVDTVCNLCPGGCGISVRKVGNRATKIEGREGYPVNDGGICPLGAAGLPWQKVSWDEAIGEVVERLFVLRKSGQSHKVACVVGSDRGTVSQLFARFMQAYGSPNFIRAASAEDTNELAVRLTQGRRGSVGYDLENADFVLSFGSGLIEGWGAPVRVIQAYSKWRSGRKKARVVQIEPRLSNTAAKADKWYPINPGTETALALGLAHVIIKEGLYDTAFVMNHTAGFSAFRSLVMDGFSPQDVSETTGIETEKIVGLARAFAKARHPLAVWGRGKGTVSGSLYECLAVHALNALVGNLNRPGGLWARPEVAVGQWPAVAQDAVARRGNAMPRLDGAGTSKFSLAQYRPDELPRIVKENPGAIQVLLVHEADPCFTSMESDVLAEALEKIPFVVSFSTYFDETASRAHLILPNHHYLERWEDVPTPIGLPRPVLGVRRPVVEKQFDTRHAGDTVMALAAGLGGSVAGSFPWDNYESLLQSTMGSLWERLNETGYVARSGKTPATFATASGKFEFYAGAYEPVEAEGDSATYPLTLIPVELMRLPDAAVGSPPFCTKTLEVTELKGNDLFVQVNPKTGLDYGLAEGRYAKLETPRGTARVLVHLSEGIMPGVVGIPKGLGHSGYDEYLSGKGVNANSLLGIVHDPISGLCATWGIRAKLTSV